MDATPFRTAAVETPTATDTSQGDALAKAPLTIDPNASGDVEVGLNLYNEVKGHPYTAEHFGLTSALEAGDMPGVSKQDIYGVDDFILSTIADRGLTNTPEAYQEVLQSIDDQIGTYENEQPAEHFKRVAAAIKAIQRMQSARVKPLLDMGNLTTFEYEAIHGLNR